MVHEAIEKHCQTVMEKKKTVYFDATLKANHKKRCFLIKINCQNVRQKCL